MEKGRITGIGGIFFKCQNPDTLKQWYQEKLGLACDQYGVLFEFGQAQSEGGKGYLQWSPFKEDTDYFKPSEKAFMINYRVDDMEAFLAKIKKTDIQLLGEVQEFEYGKFAHILDLEGNKIELWEPIDSVFNSAVQ